MKRSCIIHLLLVFNPTQMPKANLMLQYFPIQVIMTKVQSCYQKDFPLYYEGFFYELIHRMPGEL